METLELRKTIIQYAKSADKEVLTLIKEIFENYASTEEDFFDELPEEIKQLLKESRKEIAQGKFKDHEDVQAMVKEKYKLPK